METTSKLNKDLQKEDQNRLFYVVKNLVTKTVLSNKNRAKTWTYGYNEKYVSFISHVNNFRYIRETVRSGPLLTLLDTLSKK